MKKAKQGAWAEFEGDFGRFRRLMEILGGTKGNLEEGEDDRMGNKVGIQGAK